MLVKLVRKRNMDASSCCATTAQLHLFAPNVGLQRSATRRSVQRGN